MYERHKSPSPFTFVYTQLLGIETPKVPRPSTLNTVSLDNKKPLWPRNTHQRLACHHCGPLFVYITQYRRSHSIVRIRHRQRHKDRQLQEIIGGFGTPDDGACWATSRSLQAAWVSLHISASEHSGFLSRINCPQRILWPRIPEH
jgi:hypothetical protein